MHFRSYVNIKQAISAFYGRKMELFTYSMFFIGKELHLLAATGEALAFITDEFYDRVADRTAVKADFLCHNTPQ